MTETEFLTAEIRRWKKDAELFVREVLGVVPDKWQAKALRLISNPRTRRLAFKACKGPGKTAVLAWIILWFLATHYESKIGCTSITEDNINTNLWPEILKWMNRSAFLRAAFTWTKTQVTRKGNDNWFAVKRTWPKTGDQQQQADALAGIHADDVMFVLDESGGIPQAVMVTAEAVLSTFTEALERAGHRAIVVQSGNPTHTTGPLYRACTVDRALWEVITITGDPDDPDRSPRISLEWAREEIRKYGRDNPWVMVNVLGEFPPASINALLGVEEIEKAMRRHYRREVYQHAEKRLGIDVARFGDDRTVIAPRQGIVAFRPVVMRQADNVQIATRIAKAFLDWRANVVLIDDSGHWGHGAVDMLTNSSIPTIPILGEDKAPDKKYKNMRSYNAFQLAMWIKRLKGALPNMPELVPEFTEPTYTFIGNQFVLEPKDQIKERLGYSPDYFDALCETFSLPDAPAGVLEQLQGKDSRRTAKHDFDPFEMFPQLELDEAGKHLADFNPFEREVDR